MLWSISCTRLLGILSERCMIVSLEPEGVVFDVDVASSFVWPKCGPYELCIEGVAVDECAEYLEVVGICAVESYDDGSIV